MLRWGQRLSFRQLNMTSEACDDIAIPGIARDTDRKGDFDPRTRSGYQELSRLGVEETDVNQFW